MSFGCAERGGTDPVTNESQGCSVDARTFRLHKLEDQAVLARKARAASTRVVAAELDSITSYLSSVTIADKVSGPSQGPGRMWAKTKPDLQDLQSASDNPNNPLSCQPPSDPRDDTNSARNPCHGSKCLPDSRRSRVADLLQRLSVLDLSVRAFAEDTSAALERLEYPSGAIDLAYPLKALSEKGLSLESDLEGISSKEASVKELKRSISDQLHDSIKALEESNRKWKICREQSQASKSGVKCNAG